MNKKFNIAVLMFALMFAVGADAKTVCTTTNESYTEAVCHVETVEHTNRVCHDEYAAWDIFHWFPRSVCQDVTTSENVNVCENVVKTRPVESCTDVPDTTAPVITLNGQPEVEIYQGDEYHDAGATATDDEDGDITPFIVTNNPVNNNIGKYIVTYDVSDNAGNAAQQVCRAVTVKSAGSVRIPHPPKIIDYSFNVIGENTYDFNFVGKYIDGRFDYDLIKWGGTQHEMENVEWGKYKENGNIVHTDSDTVHFWFKNGDGTGNYMTVKVK